MTVEIKITPRTEEDLKELLYRVASRGDETEMFYNGKELVIRLGVMYFPGDNQYTLNLIIGFLEWLGYGYRYEGLKCSDPTVRKYMDEGIRSGLEGEKDD